MNKQLAMQRTRMYAAIREAHPLYFGDPLRFYAHGAAYTEDPYGGPAYGELNGSGGGFIGAVLSIGLAVATGGASLGFSTVASTLATVSLVSSVIGAVTGSKAFSSIGMLAGLGSSFMTLSGSGTFGADMQNWAKSADSAFAGTGTSANISDAATGSADVATSGSSMGGQITDLTATAPTVESQAGSLNLADASGVVGDPSQSAAASALKADGVGGVPPTQPTGIIDAPPVATPDAAAPPSTTAGPSDNVASKVASGADGSATMVDGATPAQVEGIAKQGAAQVAPATSSGSSGSLFDRISKFANDNKALTEMGLKGIAGMYVSPEDKAKADYYRANTELTQATIANQNSAAGIDVPSMFRVNPNANVFRQAPATAAGVRPAGIIQTRKA